MVALTIPATAQAAPAPTTIEFYGGDFYAPNKAVIFGQIFSPRARCVPGRRFKLVAKYDGEPSKVTDSGRTSREGGFAARVTDAELEGLTDLIFKVGPAKVGNRRCARARDSVDP